MEVQSPEFRLLLACVSRRGAPDTEIENLLSDGVNWAALEAMATWHGVYPNLARKLQDFPQLPADVGTRFRSASLELASRNLQFVAELTAITTAFDQQGIDYIPYKGVVLSQQLYGTIAQRRIKDIDILVKREQRLAAVACLQELGLHDDSGMTKRQLEFALTQLHEHSFVREDIGVDLHWAFAQHFVWSSIDMSEVWQSRMPYSSFGREYKVLPPGLTLVALCIHSAQDDWTQLKMFVDITALLERYPDLDWQQAERWAGDSHARRCFYVALRLAEEHLGATLPPELSAKIAQDANVRAIANEVFSKKWPSVENPILAHTELRWLLFRSRGERLLDRLRFTAGVMFGLTIGDFQRLGDWPTPLARIYFLLRPLRILAARAGRLLSRLFQRH